MSVTQLGPDVPLGRVSEGPAKVSIPPNSLLYRIQLGKDAKHGPRWFDIGYKTILGERRLDLGEEYSLPWITAPASNGGSAQTHIPEGTVITSLQLGGGSLCAWYRNVISPLSFKLGPEEPGMFTKEPADNGGGNQAAQDGYTMTGFQWLKDAPDGQLTLRIWYRLVL